MRALSISMLGVLIALPVAGIAYAAQPTVNDIAVCNQQAAARVPLPEEPRAGVPVASKPGAGDMKTDSTGSVVVGSSDPLVQGMDASKARDAAYREAYRGCMAERLKARQ
jgi:hypothetical protein